MGENLPVVNLGAERTAVAVSVGKTGTTCAILDDQRLKCWGRNVNGELGHGNTDDIGDGALEMEFLFPTNLGFNRTGKPPFGIGAGWACATLDDDSVKCWGRGDLGQNGSGTGLTLGDGANEMGPYLMPVSLY